MGEPLTEARSDMRARPVVYVSTSEGLVTDWQAYDGITGEMLHPDELPVFVVQIDWDDVVQGDPDTRAYVEDVLASGWLPERIQKDIETSYKSARRYDDL